MDQRDICEHCAITLADADCGTAEHAARWVDEDGDLSDRVWRVCSECVVAGTSGGPGYVVVEE